MDNAKTQENAYSSAISGRVTSNRWEQYYADITVLPKFPKSERELNDTSIQDIQADMCYFIHRECAHQLGRFFDNEGVLALPENESLSNWTRHII
ncbi:Os06g0341066 [Oryza sativa Japonica Group]|uniref:Os06g0341066 protein n=1 Tax=Oryza sativa subsp. japonica TaxID=39947 RepID=A0A0P0WWJ4_ORYSJ|nr:Os06g0341066 [Oryza sativa Japonica Group]